MRAVSRVLGWVAGRIPTLLVWVGLAGLFLYGAAHEWKFGAPEAEKEKAADKPAAEPDDADRPPFTPYFEPQPYDVPVLVTHDPARCTACTKTVRFASPEVAAKAGIKTTRASHDWVRVTLEAHGEVVQDPTAVGKASPRLGGTLVLMEKQLGQPVRKGELLALVEAAEVGRAKVAYLSAKVQLETREQVLQVLESGSSPARSIVEAKATVREARAALFSARQDVANLGLPLPSADEEKLPDEAFAHRLLLLGVPFATRLELYAQANAAGQPPSANLLPVFSPLDGVVLHRSGVVGEPVPARHPLYEVGDPSRVDVFLDVRQEDLPAVAIGQEVTFRLEGGANLPAVDGAIDWIGSTVDDKTRTARVRGRVPNPDGVLKSGAFGGGVITVEPLRVALVLPRESVHWEGCRHVVFVKRSEVDYMPRAVTLGVRDGTTVEITGGLESGEEVAVAGSHVLKCELLKDRIGGAEE
ncbi:MAG TPA: efflux RND transporter periplasmic adaptor subunit [Gemmataceae bacterium]|nr:efflux RND transporter periplasmic adaptor subunit [Gemmataceae bacterium]